MPKQIVKEQQIKKIKQLWIHHFTPKFISKVLKISYATVNNYVRAFKATEKQLAEEQVYLKFFNKMRENEK